MYYLFLIEAIFKIWMLIDAFKRGVEFYWYIIIFVPFGEWVYFFMVKAPELRGFSGIFQIRPRCKCDSCKYRITMYDDGVKCKPGSAPIFKTRTHINYCMDYKPGKPIEENPLDQI